MKKLLSLAVLLVPSVALAATQITDLNGVSSEMLKIGNLVIYLLISLAIVFIIWNIVLYFIRSGEPEGRKLAGVNIVWGVVGLAIALSVWGLVNILTGTFQTNTTPPTNIPGATPNNSTQAPQI